MRVWKKVYSMGSYAEWCEYHLPWDMVAALIVAGTVWAFVVRG